MPERFDPVGWERPDDCFDDDDTLTRGLVRLQFVDLGEGAVGDFDPDDPDDVALLRVDAAVRIDEAWVPIADGSWCTLVPTATPAELRRALLTCAADQVGEALNDAVGLLTASQRRDAVELDEFDPPPGGRYASFRRSPQTPSSRRAPEAVSTDATLVMMLVEVEDLLAGGHVAQATAQLAELRERMLDCAPPLTRDQAQRLLGLQRMAERERAGVTVDEHGRFSLRQLID